MAKLKDFGDLFLPDDAAEPILSEPVRGALMEWLTEVWSGRELAEVGVSHRKRAIFDGPPGVGKTTLAHHLAARLGLPMLAVRSEKLIDKYVGQSAQNVAALFDAAKLKGGDPAVLFFDEFDSLGSARSGDNSSAGAERNGVVNTLLQKIERFDGFLIAATNYGPKIDQAIWRRFDIQIRLELPAHRERELILERYLHPFAFDERALSLLADAVDGASPALIKGFCEGLKRQTVIGPKLEYDMSIGPVIGRVVAALRPPPQLEAPPLWEEGGDHPALRHLPWPLPRPAA